MADVLSVREGKNEKKPCVPGIQHCIVRHLVKALAQSHHVNLSKLLLSSGAEFHLFGMKILSEGGLQGSFWCKENSLTYKQCRTVKGGVCSHHSGLHGNLTVIMMMQPIFKTYSDSLA